MTRKYIELRKQRDFSSLLSDTFAFIRIEFKPFMKAIFNISGPAMIVFLIAMAFYTYTAGDIFNFDIAGTSGANGFVSPALIIISAIAYAATAIVAYVFAGSAALHYIKSYIDNKGQVDLKEVKRNVYDTFWGFFGLSFLKGITIGFSVLLCVLPVLYTMVPMTIVLCIYVFSEKHGAIEAYGESFSLVNEDFWTALGTILVFIIIFYILSMVFAVPAVIYTYIKMGIFSGEFDPANMNNIVDPVYIILNVLSTLFQFLLNLIIVVASAFIYFHLNEKRNFTGTYDRINQIGNTEA